jgi:hypothetical protein
MGSSCRSAILGLGGFYLAAAALTLSAGCSGSGSPSGASPSVQPRSAASGGAAGSVISAQLVYARAERSLRAGGVYHVRQSVATADRQLSGPTPGPGPTGHESVEFWIYLTGGQALIKATDVDIGNYRFVIEGSAGSAWSRHGPEGKIASCKRISAITGLAFGCLPQQGTVQSEQTSVSRVLHAGRAALMLVRRDVLKVYDEGSAYTRIVRTRIFLDPATGLPFSHDGSSMLRTSSYVGTGELLTRTSSIQSEFVPRASLSATFFAHS